GMSVVPAQTTATTPRGACAGPGALAWKVRDTASYFPSGAAAIAAGAASGNRRVTRTACPSSRSRATSFPICSGDLRSPKITSGAPCRTARSPSSWANSAILCTGSSARVRAASATASSPLRTFSSSSLSPFRSTRQIYTWSGPKAFRAEGAEVKSERAEEFHQTTPRSPLPQRSPRETLEGSGGAEELEEAGEGVLFGGGHDAAGGA